MKNFSFLLGAGFSVPDGYPTVQKLNNKLKNLKASEIYINSDLSAGFLNGNTDRNAFVSEEERLFVQLFLEFYNKEVLKPGEQFHYENFFDYYTGLRTGIKCDKYEKFCKEHKIDEIDRDQNVFRFHNTFIQLIWHELHKTYEKVHLAKPYHPNYNMFLYLMEYLGNEFIIHIHSLNLDLLIEYLSYSDGMKGKLSDGFTELGSQFYGQHHDGYKIRLRYFADEYSEIYRLYKLHGSVDHIPYNFDNKEYTVVKLEKGIHFTKFYKEYMDNKGELKYHNCSWNSYPDFLCGTTEKIKRYNDNYYYKKVFDHFRNNLGTSDYLIVIGYSFRDVEINNIIEKNFLNDNNKKMLIIDPVRPATSLLSNKNVFYIAKGVSDITLEEIKKTLGIKLIKKNPHENYITQPKVVWFE